MELFILFRLVTVGLGRLWHFGQALLLAFKFAGDLLLRRTIALLLELVDRVLG